MPKVSSLPRIQPLDHRFSLVDKHPASNRYAPYGVLISVPDPNPGRSWHHAQRDFEREILLFAQGACQHGVMLYNADKCSSVPTGMVRAITHTLEDLYTLYGHYYQITECVTGPFDDTHIQMLEQDGFSLESSKKLYYGQYDCRLTLSQNWRVVSSRGKELLKEAHELVKINMDQYRRQRASGYYSREVHYYTDLQSALTLRPIISLAFGDEINYSVRVRMQSVPGVSPQQLELFPDK